MIYDLLTTVLIDRYNLFIVHHEMYIPVSILYADQCVSHRVAKGMQWSMSVTIHCLAHSKFSHTLLFLLREAIGHLEEQVNTPGE